MIQSIVPTSRHKKGLTFERENLIEDVVALTRRAPIAVAMVEFSEVIRQSFSNIWRPTSTVLGLVAEDLEGVLLQVINVLYHLRCDEPEK